jgi:exosortase
VLLAACVAALVYFYGFLPLFESGHGATPFDWLWRCWQADKLDYAHGKLIPLASAYLVWRQRKELASAAVAPSLWGLAVMLVGVLIYLASVRTLQPRLALGALPLLVVGGAAYAHSWRVARILAFPSFILYFGIPVPGLTQATNGLQIIATSGAYHLVSLLGIDAVASGNYLRSATDAWGFDVAEGCSGIRSLMALTLIAAVYGYLVHKEWWKRMVLFLISFPLAIVANTFRVASIVLIAEWFNPEFAGDLYHHYSGFLFFPFGLAALVLVSKAMNFSENFSRRVVKVRRAGAAVAPPGGYEYDG